VNTWLEQIPTASDARGPSRYGGTVLDLLYVLSVLVSFALLAAVGWAVDKL